MEPQKKPVNWRAWLVGILSALVLIVALQNSQEVSVEVLFASFNAPLIVVILLAAAIGVLIGYIAPLVRRHRREERHQQHNS
ncbi:MAG TPA: LapA family protein [Solirubrobacterales bacterium]|nr:LapA family protein [Solirubrobacterales bacterium]